MRWFIVLVLFWEVCPSMTIYNAKMSFKTSDAVETRSMVRHRSGRAKRAGKDPYVVNLYIVFDKEAKEIVGLMEPKVLKPEGVTIEKFFAHYYRMLVASIDTFMKSLRDQGLQIYVKGMGSEVSRIVSFESLSHKRWQNSGRLTSCAEQTLKAFEASYKKFDLFLKYNHVMLVTGYILTDKGGHSVAGIANQNSVCTASSYSVVPFDFNLDPTISTAARQIAISLGVTTYDGEGAASKCKESKGYVMAKNPLPRLKAGPRYWKFSSCSVDALKAAMKLQDKKPSGNCLKKSYRNERLPIKNLMGSLLSPKALCQLLAGRYAQYIQKSDGDKLCSEYPCNAAVRNTFEKTTHLAYWGTPCKTNKWCVNDKCVGSSG